MRRSRQDFTTAGALVIAAAVLSTVGGCAQAYYRQFQLGQQPAEYERILPAGSSRRTSIGLCYLGTDLAGRTDALVILVTDDRRVAAKLHAAKVQRRIGGLEVERGYRLEGELDPRLCGIEGAGPLNGLRMLAGRLAEQPGQALELDAHWLVAGGLVRLLQAWPGVGEYGVEERRLSELFERVPGGGTAEVRLDPRGVWTVRYEQGVVR